MFFAKIPRHTRQNAITEGDLKCILTRNCEGTEQLRLYKSSYYNTPYFLMSISFVVKTRCCEQNEQQQKLRFYCKCKEEPVS